MNRNDFIKLHEHLCNEARAICVKKNRDYAGGTDDPFANFRACETLGVPCEIGILMRCMDKFQRIRAFVDTGTLDVANESAKDAVMDTLNYMTLLYGVMEERENEKSTVSPGRVPGDVYCVLGVPAPDSGDGCCNRAEPCDCD